MASKSKFTCLLTLIKHHSKDLYDLINDLCLDGSFRTQKYANTLLMPNSKLVAKIKNMVEKDKDEEAINAIRSLMLKGHISESDFKKDAAIGTLRYGHILADPASIKGKIKTSSKSLISKDGNAVVTIIYDYSGEDAPETKEGASPAPQYVSAVKSGNDAKEIKHLRDLTKSLIHENSSSKTIQNFFKAVAGALSVLQHKEGDHYMRAKYFLAANPILSWFFLTMPGRQDALVSFEDIENFEWQNVVDPESIIKDCENAQYSLNKEVMKHIKSARSRLVTNGDKSSLIKMITNCYEKDMATLVSKNSTDKLFQSEPYLKLLMDENRFIYESAINSWDEVDDAIKAMGAIDWSRPMNGIVLCDQKIQDTLKSAEAFLSGPTMFVKSVYFLYVPLTESIEDQLTEVMKGGAIHGGNPHTVNSVVFSGGAARKALKKSSGSKLKSILKMLSKSQKEELKKML